MLDEKCGYCRYCMCDYDNMKRNDEGKFYCDRENIWVSLKGKPFKRNCYWEVPLPQNRYRIVESHYIITAIISILGYERDSYGILTMDWFRPDVLEKDPKFAEDLEFYNTYGPIIAKKIYEAYDNDPKQCKRKLEVLLHKEITPVCNLIYRGRNCISLNDNENADILYRKATQKYMDMVKRLYNELVLGNDCSYEYIEEPTKKPKI